MTYFKPDGVFAEGLVGIGLEGDVEVEGSDAAFC
jgi:hypothetical protein